MEKIVTEGVKKEAVLGHSEMIVIFHTPSNAGYAMATLEKIFFDVACEVVGRRESVHFGFKDIESGMPWSLPASFKNVIAVDPSKPGSSEFLDAEQYIRDHHISIAMCFDMQPRSQLGNMLRRAGVRKIVSYWGSTISSKNRGIRLLLKKLDVALSFNRPDLFIFESEGMRDLAVYGRGIRRAETRVVPTGIDINRFRPDKSARCYLGDSFDIAERETVVFYSGHMEERKGVRVIIEAAIDLIDRRKVEDICFLICGNRPGEEKLYLDILNGTLAEKKVIFAGYRSDLDRIIPGCDIGVIASTGWDSFPMSSLEMAACGLPVIVSDLEGIRETIEPELTGFLFEPGSADQLADKIILLKDNSEVLFRMSQNARARIVAKFSTERQRRDLVTCINEIIVRS